MRIHAIQTGRVQVKQSQTLGRRHGLARRAAPLFDAHWSDWLPVNAFAIEHAEGVILVDAGSNAGLMNLPRWHPYFRFAVRFDIDRENQIGPRLKALGISPRDVTKIVLTHLHIDHDGGLADFPGVETLVSRGELAAASGFAGQIRGYLPQRWPSGFDPTPLDFADEPFGPFPRSRRLTADGAILAVPTPGHTDHHISVVVDDGERLCLLAGDASYDEANMIAGSIDGVAGDEAAAAETLARLRALAADRPAIYLPTHDPRTAERLNRRQTVAGAAKFGADATPPRQTAEIAITR